ncbi:Cysteine dioxygenase [Penicillium taxi]|uniref:Cysteine dioxygenase n=1 Tax=Penicillium taxi TaxID=168475 RepID=UPI0025453294|nr:Cysteine dioxygenase [Penicillium taxi]KAJ5894150.1 Cysteine dioxygenase [Penicillium taxi]
MKDSSRTYTRNLIDEGIGKSNLLILVWSPVKEVRSMTTPMRMSSDLKLSRITHDLLIQKTLYSWPDEDKVAHGEPSPPQITRETTLHSSKCYTTWFLPLWLKDWQGQAYQTRTLLFDSWQTA